ncbi:MAG: DUF1273 family protein [Oscillospiraceae bacterium]|nr:DUF1273 family protein [Oscillospiraceae bacterium]
MYRISFTGYRDEKLPFFGEDDPMCVELKQRLSDWIKKLADEGAGEFYSGMALGVDTWAAEAVLELKESRPEIKLIAVIPCPEQDERWSAANRQRYREILERCDKVMTVSPNYHKGCMQKRNRALVEMCDVLLAVYDGKPGGTQFTVNFAQKKGKKVIVVEPM